MRIFFIGDSLTQGFGDPSMRGWPGRIAEAHLDPATTAYNLGVRGNAAPKIAERFEAEVAARLADEPNLFVFCFGTADSTQNYPPEQSLAAARDLFGRAGKLGTVLFMTPPPVLNEEVRSRVDALSEALKRLCAEMDVPCHDLNAALQASQPYLDSLQRSDAVHPDSEGYGLMADIVGQWGVLREALRQA